MERQRRVPGGPEGCFRFRKACSGQILSGWAVWPGYPWSMAKSQDKKRTDKTNKPKLTPKEKKLKKAAKKSK